MFKTIVLALDGSEESRRAIPMATEPPWRDSARFLIVHVDERTQPGAAATSTPDEAEIQAAVRQQAEEFSKQGIETTIRMCDVRSVVPPDRSRRLPPRRRPT